ncbi:hypothetical protein [Actinomycetospora soli]|uniref:hypothetical protein n=1 Tax=Actinomycetospora soli TaxID=2893887 RepID=UPI001E41579B|nr:hypothetical protein [Actinomycetospora soli]MCD2187787.1 hypothetical protein [Actinomycetospora soli]
MVLSPVSLVALVLGVACLGVGAVAWSGAWRGWASPEPTRSAPITLVPGVGLFLVTLGALPLIVPPLGGFVTLAGLLAAVGSWLVLLSEPPWWGPRWWRERGRGGGPSDVQDVLWVGRVPPERDSEYLVLSERAPETPRWRREVVLLDPELGRPTLVHDDGACRGSLLAFHDDLVFAADRRDDATRPGPTIRVLPADGLAVRRGRSPRNARMPVVIVSSADGTWWQFEVARPGSAVAAVRRLYPS